MYFQWVSVGRWCLTNAASAPWRPSHAGAGNAPHSVLPKTGKFGGCSPPPKWGMQHRAGGAASPSGTHRRCAALQCSLPWVVFCLCGWGGRGCSLVGRSGMSAPLLAMAPWRPLPHQPIGGAIQVSSAKVSVEPSVHSPSVTQPPPPQELMDCIHSTAHTFKTGVGRRDDANWCEERNAVSEDLTGGGGGLTAMSRRGTCLSALMPQRGDAALDRTEHDRRTSAKQNQVASAHPESTLKKMETKHVPVIRPPMAKSRQKSRNAVSEREHAPFGVERCLCCQWAGGFHKGCGGGTPCVQCHVLRAGQWGKGGGGDGRTEKEAMPRTPALTTACRRGRPLAPRDDAVTAAPCRGAPRTRAGAARHAGAPAAPREGDAQDHRSHLPPNAHARHSARGGGPYALRTTPENLGCFVSPWNNAGPYASQCNGFGPRRDGKEALPTQAHAGGGCFLPSSGGRLAEWNMVHRGMRAHGTGPIPKNSPFPCRPLVARLACSASAVAGVKGSQTACVPKLCWGAKGIPRRSPTARPTTVLIIGWTNEGQNGGANPAAPAARHLGSHPGTREMVPFVNRTFGWGAVIATFLSVLSIALRHCARATYFLRPKLRKVNAVPIPVKPFPSAQRRLQRAVSARNCRSRTEAAGGRKGNGARSLRRYVAHDAAHWHRLPPWGALQYRSGSQHPRRRKGTPPPSAHTCVKQATGPPCESPTSP